MLIYSLLQLNCHKFKFNLTIFIQELYHFFAVTQGDQFLAAGSSFWTPGPRETLREKMGRGSRKRKIPDAGRYQGFSFYW